ncbi:hypothetical protein F5B20DRAFT_595893 [Whalleya microplaca]|nr:hypothetical protein F5B20DRAFT_595893 [Whalleya microplaca]
MPSSSSIGRIQAGFAQATQELTVAAANLNFDFTLIKLEAPPEYRAIGNVLSPSRVHEAENGPLHVTARRLGALFDGVCPHTPTLIKAYGTRASEISQEVANTDSNASRGLDWIRSEYGGIDATSIWASATSSKAALPVHLLASISLWVELIAERKREIVAQFESGGSFPTALASAVQQEITRDHIAKWDSSARAWLQTADATRERQYKQFLLIIQNISIAIHEANDSLYSSVVRVWTSALVAMEGLISGSPSVVKDGSVLLGLSAWHLYPDMVVFNNPSGNTEIEMHDPLIKAGGVLSLGISDPSQREGHGVYWSLSLAHHRYYGEATAQTRRLDIDGSRLSFSELVLVCLGSLSRGWSLPVEGTHEVLKILEAIAQTMPSKNEDGWKHIIYDSLRNFLSEQKQAIRAVFLGRRRPKFLPTVLTVNRKPLFQLIYLPTLLFLLKDVDRKIELLRRLGSRVHGLDGDNSVIVCYEYVREKTNTVFCSVFREESHNEDELTQSRKRNTKHHRWIDLPKMNDARDDVKTLETNGDGIYGMINPSDLLINPFEATPPEQKRPHTEDSSEEGSENEYRYFMGRDLSPTAEFETGIDLETRVDKDVGNQKDTDLESKCTGENLELSITFDATMKEQRNPRFEKYYAAYLDEVQRNYPNERVRFISDKDEAWYQDIFWKKVTHSEDPENSYDFLFGQTEDCAPDGKLPVCEHAAIYAKGHVDIMEENYNVVALEDVLWCFQSGLIDPNRLNTVLAQEPALAFLKVLSTIHTLYQKPAAGGATISCTIVDSEFKPPIFSKKLESHDWFEAHTHISINQRSAIGLIGYFETGYDVSEGMKGDYNTIGLSGGDSIYILTALLSDPIVVSPDYSFTRILGNTGKAGFSLLVCPSNLMARQFDRAAWRIEQAEFDGMAHDYFKNTSLHLTFTDWCAPIVSFQTVGQRDADVNIIETVVSVRDSGKWVADVDIYQTLVDPGLQRYNRECSHVSAESKRAISSMSSVESWDQVLDCADGSTVVRCFNNWVARLAVVSVLHRHGTNKDKPIVVCPRDTCWMCVDEAVTSPGKIHGVVHIF